MFYSRGRLVEISEGPPKEDMCGLAKAAAISVSLTVFPSPDLDFNIRLLSSSAIFYMDLVLSRPRIQTLPQFQD